MLCAVQAGYEEIVDQLLHGVAGPSALTTAKLGDEAGRQVELEKSILDAVAMWGNMGNAFRPGQRNIVILFLNAGINASATTHHDRTLLRYN